MSNSKTIPYPGARIHIVYIREFPHPNQAEVGKTEKICLLAAHIKRKTASTRGPYAGTHGNQFWPSSLNLPCPYTVQRAPNGSPSNSKGLQQKVHLRCKFWRGPLLQYNTVTHVLNLGRHELTVRTSCMASAQLT